MSRGAVLAIVLGGLVMAQGCDKPGPEDPVIEARADDPRLIAAREGARAQWPTFVRAVRQREPNVAYAVKCGLPTKGGSVEHVWLQVTGLTDTHVTGVLDNIPHEDIGHVRGDTVVVAVEDVEDWLIGRGPGNLVGGFSIKALTEIERDGP